MSLEVELDSGSGRAWIILHEKGEFFEFSRALSEKLQSYGRVISITLTRITGTSWRTQSAELLEILEKLQVRQMSFIAFAGASSVAEAFILNNPKGVRVLVSVDAATRPHPTRMSRVIDKLESWLPFGLPLRNASGEFDIRPFAHRLRIPTLFVSTKNSSQFLIDEAEAVTKISPTACHVKLLENEACAPEELAKIAESFQFVPVKCPQKNIMSVRGAQSA